MKMRGSGRLYPHNRSESGWSTKFMLLVSMFLRASTQDGAASAKISVLISLNFSTLTWRGGLAEPADKDCVAWTGTDSVEGPGVAFEATANKK